MNIVIGVFALLVYMCVAKRYKYSNIHQYAENYYSNQPTVQRGESKD